MTKYITILCPNCKRSLQVRAQYLGKRINCKACKYTFRASEGNSQASATLSDIALPPQPQVATLAKSNDLDRDVGQKNDLERLWSEHAVALENLRQAQEESARFQSEVQELKKRQAQASQLQHKMTALERELDRARAMLAQAEADRQQVSALQYALAEANTALAQHQSEVQELRSQAVETERWRVELKASRTEIAHLQSEIQARKNQGPRNLEVLEQELREARAERDRLNEEVHRTRARIAANLSNTERLCRLVEELEAARGERDLLTHERDTEIQATEELWARIKELEQSLAEATTSSEVARTEMARAHQEARGQWETERREMQGQWEQKYQTYVQELNRRFDEEVKRMTAEKVQLQKQLEEARVAADREPERVALPVDERAAFPAGANDVEKQLAVVRQQFEEERAQLQSEIERYCEENANLRRTVGNLGIYLEEGS